MQPKKKSFKLGALLVGTSFWGIIVLLKYVLMKSALESRLLTVERVSPEKWELIYREEINHLIERNYLSGAILFIWLLYLLWRWIRFLRHAYH
jgi:hypothetical protein